jgi:hypothetical protein
MCGIGTNGKAGTDFIEFRSGLIDGGSDADTLQC